MQDRRENVGMIVSCAQEWEVDQLVTDQMLRIKGEIIADKGRISDSDRVCSEPL